MTDPQISALRAHFNNGSTRPLAWRRAQLDALTALCRECEDEIATALKADLGKPGFEAYASEIAFIASHARHAARNLKRWSRRRRVSVDLANLPARAWLEPQPRGVTLILSPWNYPFHLALSPLIGALAAGNCAVIKPSEHAPATAALLQRLVPRYLDPQAVRVVQGDAATAQALLDETFDLVFFTGSTAVGRKVMQAASRHLTPVVLELGGKSPAIVTRDADLDVAARRIAWGKCLNAGQTCIAPDYLLLETGLKDAFLSAYAKALRQFLGADPRTSTDYCRIINRAHFDRLAAMLDDGTVVLGGQSDADALFIEPTVLCDLPNQSPAMTDEIFGPILPLIEIDSLDDALNRIRSGPKPLGLYVFSTAKETHRRVIDETQSGAVVINDVMMQVTPPDLPFGGVGASGIGAYHGQASFDTFSHLRPVLRRWYILDAPVRYPPYTRLKERVLRRVM